jgi:two-component system, OmpR family, sensor histidine kinase KdpD
MDVEDLRPDPDRLLERLKAEEAGGGRGALKIFFGYVAGVGKTYAMLEAARRRAAAGVDVVVGYVEPHGRSETEALLDGLDVLGPAQVAYRGITLGELDLDAALARRPRLILVDELAHTNAPGLRHQKRWQDVEELLEAGIDVYTTVNVQHLESLNDVIAQITGVQVRETVPDAVFDEADSVEVVDLPPRELFQRLREGKVYLPAQAARAMEGFFKPAPIGALREITLRRTADRVHSHLETTRLAQGGPRQTWAVMETLLVCVGPSPTSAKVIRTSKRMAVSLNARWIAVAVAKSTGRGLGPAAEERLHENVRLAERLGAETATISGDDVAEEIMTYARSQNVTKIVIGKTAVPRWRRVLQGGVVEDLLDRSGDIDVYVVQGREESQTRARTKPALSIAWPGYGWALATVVVAGLVAWGFQDLGLAEANKAIIFVLAAALVAARFGWGPGLATTIVGILLFDFFFVKPYLTFAVADAQYVITFAIMLAVALIISTLAGRLRRQVRVARARERRLEALFRLSRELSGLAGPQQLAAAAQREVAAMLDREVVIYLPVGDGGLEPVVGNVGESAAPARETAVATWVLDHGQSAGPGTDTLTEATLVHVPMITPQGVAGVLSIAPSPGKVPLSTDLRQLLEMLATQIGTAIERDELAVETRRVLLQIGAGHPGESAADSGADGDHSSS